VGGLDPNLRPVTPAQPPVGGGQLAIGGRGLVGNYSTRTAADSLGTLVTTQRSGHILGAASAHLELDNGETIVFSGDLGRSQHPLLVPPAPIGAADTIVVESTYGNRSHGDADPVETLADAVRRTAARGGTVIIPSFAVDRTEVLLFHLRQLMADDRVPNLPVYVDSPMALAALAVYREAIANRSAELRPEVLVGHLDPFDTGTLTEVRDVEEPKRLHRNRFPSIIISASGMATGGRVLHHLANRLPDNRNTILLAGFQVAGTRGRRLADGERQIKLLGRYVPVKTEIVNLPALSVHADRDEIVQWLGTATREPLTTFVVHGESEASNPFVMPSKPAWSGPRLCPITWSASVSISDPCRRVMLDAVGDRSSSSLAQEHRDTAEVEDRCWQLSGFVSRPTDAAIDDSTDG
jgi:Cft2 family RNA processing exonuclease